MTYLPVVRESAEGGDVLHRQVGLRRGGPDISLLPDAVDLLVQLGTVVVTVLTGAGDGEAHAGRVPRADASNLAETAVGLARKTGHAPTRDHALGTVTLGGTEHIDTLVLSTSKRAGTYVRKACIQFFSLKRFESSNLYIRA